MKTSKLALLIACTFASAQAHAQLPAGATGKLLPTQAPTQLANESTYSTGTILKKDIRWESRIPLNKTYAQLTPEQKAELHALYQVMPEGDEPPFPEQGMKAIFNPVRNAARIAKSRGELNMVVTVGPDGKATHVESYSSASSSRLVETTEQILLLTRFKPGICNGQPCTMQFRFQQKLNAG